MVRAARPLSSVGRVETRNPAEALADSRQSEGTRSWFGMRSPDCPKRPESGSDRTAWRKTQARSRPSSDVFSLRRAERISIGIVVGATAIGIALAPRLPAEVAIHFAASGAPDNYVPRIVALFSVPVVALATITVVRGAARLDPPNDPRSIDTLVVGMTAMLCAIHLLVLA